MRVQANKYMRNLPSCFHNYNRRTYTDYNLCSACGTELYRSWEMPFIDNIHLGNSSLFCTFNYQGKQLIVDYSSLNNREYIQKNIAENKANGIPEQEVQKKIEYLQGIRREEEKAVLERKNPHDFCPVCQNPLGAYLSYYTQINERLTPDECDNYQKRYAAVNGKKPLDNEEYIYGALNFNLQKQDESAIEKRYNTTYTRFDVSAFSAEGIDTTIKENPERLKKYIQHLFTLETNIYSVSKRLRDLYALSQTYERNVRRRISLLETDIRSQVIDYKTQYNNALAELKRIQSAGAEKVHVARPTEPRKPSAPILEKPGLFNKKKVLAHNEELTAAYEKACQQYELDLAAHKSALEACAAKEAQLVQEAEQRYAQSLSAAEAEVAVAKAQMEQSTANIDAQIEAACALPSPETIAKQMLDDEIAQAEKMLKELIECRNKLYACDVVFIKYRNMVVLATFYEYLISGRCTTLEGPDGAYNIFESECRANQIIGQLNKIVDSLEQIKGSQYLIYSQLQSINTCLTTMNTTMQSMSRSLQSIQADTHSMSGYMETVAKNSDVIAHNTAVSAYYSKMNAELTNSLGYLLALK